MGGLSIWHWIVVIAVLLLLFGRGKISELMGDVAQGIKAFKKGMREAEMAELKQQFDAIHDAAKDIRNFDPVGTARDQIEGAVADKPAETAPSGPAAATPTQSPEPASTVPEAAAESRPPETS